jgi:hypothetical protein
MQQRQAAQAQDEHDLLGRIRHGRERIGAEHRQGEALREQRLTEAVGAERLAEQYARNACVRGHTSVLRAHGGPAANPDAFLTPAARALMLS